MLDLLGIAPKKLSAWFTGPVELAVPFRVLDTLVSFVKHISNMTGYWSR